MRALLENNATESTHADKQLREIFTVVNFQDAKEICSICKARILQQ